MKKYSPIRDHARNECGDNKSFVPPKTCLCSRLLSFSLTLVLLGDRDPLREGRVERGEVAVPELSGLDPEELARLQRTKERLEEEERRGTPAQIAMSITDDSLCLRLGSLSHLRDCHFPIEIEPIPPLL